MFDSLKGASDSTKRKVALLIAGIVSVVILAVWIKVTYRETIAVAKETKESGVAFWSKLKENMASAAEGIGSRIGNIKDQVGAIKEEVVPEMENIEE
ncbi:MAG TPA: hypothetical protein VEC13_02350 [Candidatus Paceibacterota bacterium]|nr:hypothetical protein [Candidatus Paceibacterota bacterium]